MYGSDKVFKAMNEWLKYCNSQNNQKEMLNKMLKLLVLIRKDLQNNSKLKEDDILMNIMQSEDEIKKLFSRQTPGQSSPTQIVRGFLGEQERSSAAFCALLDFPGVTEIDGMELYRKLQDERSEGISSMSYEYHDEGQLLRVAVSGDTGAVMDLLEQMKAGMKSA